MLLEITFVDPKKGDVKYSISPFIFNWDSLREFWEKSSKYPVLFNEEIRRDFTRFCEVFIGGSVDGGFFPKGLVFRIDSEHEPLVGVFYMTDINFPSDAIVHFSFLDGRIKGRAPLAKAMLEHAFKKYNFNRLSAELPAYVRSSAKLFVRDIGFTVEGKKRQAAEFDNRMWDVILYGITREEVITNGG